MGSRSNFGRQAAAARDTLFLCIALGLAACSGGSGPTDIRRSNCDGPDQNVICLERCNLGCSNRTTCSITEIAQNQALVFVFSRELDPSSINSSSVQLRTSTKTV